MELMGEYKYYMTASKFEGNPKSTLEALSSGCIVFASDIQNHKELIKNKVNGFLFCTKDNDLLEIFKFHVENSNLYEVSKNAKKIFQSNSLEIIAEKELTDIESLKI